MSPADSNNPHELLLVAAGGEAVNLVMTEEGLSIVKRKGKFGSISRASSSLRIASGSSHSLIPYFQVVSASFSRDKIKLVYVSTKKGGKIVTLEGSTAGDEAESWCKELTERAYEGKASPKLSFYILLNPNGGKGQAAAIFRTSVEPLLKLSSCTYVVQHTGPPNSHTNAKALGAQFVKDGRGEKERVMMISGDGIVHEFVNGVMEAEGELGEQEGKRTKITAAHVPAGSGNALNVNIVGPKLAGNALYACLVAIKGTPHRLDVCKFKQSKGSCYSFLSQAFGLMADLDLGTEHMRWMGETRFTVGYIQGALAVRKYPITLLMHLITSSKPAMLSSYATARHLPPVATPVSALGEPTNITEHDRLPRAGEVWEEGWHRVTTDVMFAYGGKLPWIARDVMMFPPAGNDGLIDLCIVPPLSRIDALTSLDGAELGKPFMKPTTAYFKCSYYKLTPHQKSGYISIDGESFPFEEFEASCLGDERGGVEVMGVGGKWWSQELKF